MIWTPGYVRIRGEGKPLLTGDGVHVEVQRGDGEWLPLRGVRSVAVTILPNEFAFASMEINVSVVDLIGAIPNEIVWVDTRSPWRKFMAWLGRV